MFAGEKKPLESQGLVVGEGEERIASNPFWLAEMEGQAFSGGLGDEHDAGRHEADDNAEADEEQRDVRRDGRLVHAAQGQDDEAQGDEHCEGDGKKDDGEGQPGAQGRAVDAEVLAGCGEGDNGVGVLHCGVS